MWAGSFNTYRLAIAIVMTLALLPGIASPAMANQQPGATPVGGDPVPPELIAELALPATTEATCDVGPAVTAPPSTELVTYGDVGAVANGDGTHTFTYTATVTAEGATLPDVLPEGYARDSDTLAIYTVTLPEADCDPQAQRSGSIGIMSGGSDESCVGGSGCLSVDVSAPDTIAPGATLTYTITLERRSTTPLLDWFKLDLPGDGWSLGQDVNQGCSIQGSHELLCYLITLNDREPRTYTVSRTVTEGCGAVITSDGGQVENTPPVSIGSFSTTVVCPASPEAPTIMGGSCIDGFLVEPSITFPTTTGISYDFSPKPLPLNGSVTVTATLGTGHSWGDTTGWNVIGDSATRNFPVSSTDCVADLVVNKSITAVNGQPVTAPLASVTQDDVVTYQIAVENTGTATLTNLTVSDPGVTDLACDATLPVTSFGYGDTVTCTATHVVSEADVIAGVYINTATASATWDGSTVYGSASVVVTTVEAVAAITLEKSVDPIAIDAPGPVTYTFVITNAGTLALNELTLVDDRVDLTALDCDGEALPTSLTAGTRVTCTVDYAITQEMIDAGGPIVNEATARATGSNAEPVESTSSASLTVTQNPAMTFAKTADVDTYDAVDDAIVYFFNIRNTGNVTLTGLSLTDTFLASGAISCAHSDLPDTIAPGQLIECVALYAVTQDDLDAGSVTNTATASSDQTAAIDDSVTVTAVQNPVLTLDKTASTPDGETVTTGTVITYQFTVTNGGNVTIDDIVVADALTGLVWDDANPGGAVGTLGPKETATLTATYTVTDVDVEAGNVTNLAEARGTLAGCADVATLRQDDGDRCGIVSEAASVSVELVAPPTATATATVTATATATKTVAVKVLPSTGHGDSGSGAPMASLLLALAALLGIAAIVTSRRARIRIR